MNLITNTTAIAAVALLLAITGCARETSSDTRADVAEAQADGAEDVSSARTEAADEMADASKEVTAMERDAANQAAESAMAVTVAESEAAHKVATERCESQSGDARAQCKDLADVELKAAKDRAEATRLATTQQN
jgi:hypothetical protein